MTLPKLGKQSTTEPHPKPDTCGSHNHFDPNAMSKSCIFIPKAQGTFIKLTPQTSPHPTPCMSEAKVLSISHDCRPMPTWRRVIGQGAEPPLSHLTSSSLGFLI